MSKKNYFIVFLIIVGFLVYANTLFNGFVWDDEEYIVKNQLVHSIKNIPLFLKGLSRSYYRPVMLTIYSLIFSVFGPRPFFFHLFQVMAHITNAVLIFFLIRYFFDDFLSFFLSMIFLVHPMNVEAVSWISATQEVLFVQMGIIALLVLVKTKAKYFRHLLLIEALLFTSLLIKETGVVFFMIVFFYLVFFNRKWLYHHLLAAFISISFYITLRFIMETVYIQDQGLFPIMRAPLTTRLLTIPKVTATYFTTFFFPKDLAIDQQWVVYVPHFHNFILPLLIVLLLIAISLVFLLRTRNKVFLFFLIWLMLGLLPHLHIVPLNMTFAERWFYLPMIGLLGIFGVVITKLKLKDMRLVNAVFIILAVLLSIRSFIRTLDWRNGLTLFRNDSKISKDAFDLENNFGVELVRVGKIDEAGQHLKKSVYLAPYWWVSLNNLGSYYMRKGDLKKAEYYYKRSIQNGDYYLAYENLTALLVKQSRKREALEFLEKKALVKFPNNKRMLNIYSFLKNK